MNITKWRLASVAVCALAGSVFIYSQVNAEHAAETTAAAETEMEQHNDAAEISEAEAEAETPDYFLGDYAIGAEDAPLTIIEYASLSCSHCADFHRETYYDFKEAYVDTGKVRFIYRDFPTNQLALAGAMLARCGGENKYEAFIDLLMRSQQDPNDPEQGWLTASDKFGRLKELAAFGGINEAQFLQCMGNNELAEAIVSRATIGQTEHNISSTPSFFIEGTVYSGNRSLEEFSALIDPILAQKAE